MKERINRLANGMVEYSQSELNISQTEIEEHIYGNSGFRGEFNIAAKDGSLIKGLVYSTNIFVKVISHAFGGTDNKIQYEVRFDNKGHIKDIEGAFHLVTSSGEVCVPYRFFIRGGVGDKTLGSFETLQDFAKLACEKPETALRIFDYAEFVKAPFMKDMTIRSIYDSIHGKGKRELALEEFLIGTAAKDPIEISILKDTVLVFAGAEEAFVSIPIEKNTWGYLQIEVSVDASFLVLEKEKIYDSDFRGNNYELPVRINGKGLHKGRNYGKIHLVTSCQELIVRIIALQEEEDEYREHNSRTYKQSFRKYMELRLDYESEMYEGAQLLDKMEAELTKLMAGDSSNLSSLLLAENYILQNKLAEAGWILDERREDILANRLNELDVYCFYQYLQSKIPGREGQAASLLRLLQKYNEEKEERFYLYLLLLKLNGDLLLRDKALVLERLKELFKGGTRSPFLYLVACRIYNEDPKHLRKLGDFELQAVHFGVKRGVIELPLALKVAELAAFEKGCRKLFQQILEGLYKSYQRLEILEGLCSILIKGNVRSSDCFEWFAKGVSEGLKLTRLFEYYLYTLPKDFSERLPKEILLYFSYPNSLGTKEREALYYNILTHVEKNSPIYQAYERQLEEFALASLFEGRINDKMAVIYRCMIYRELIDERIAKVFPEILRSYRIECDSELIRHVVVSYEALREKVVAPVQNGVAYVPMYVEDCLILFQDAFGNRYMEVDYKISRLMREKELEERCFDVCDNHLMLQLHSCKEILKRGRIESEEILLVEKLLTKNVLHELYEERLLSLLVQYYRRSETDSDYSMLVSIDKERLSETDRMLCIEALIEHGHYRDAYEMIGIYGYDKVKSSRLLKLCSKMILQHLFDENSLLLSLSFQLFSQGLSDNVILDYLCEYYNGMTEEMYQILIQAVELHVETYNMEERLLGQMLFTNQTEHLNEVFKLYVSRKEVKESMLKAYLTVACNEYFLHNQSMESDYLEYVEECVQRLFAEDQAPLIWQLALVRYYSEAESLDEQQKTLCEELVNELLAKGYVFACMERLAGFISLPKELIGKKIIEFRGAKELRPYIKTWNAENNRSHIEAMGHVYEGVFVKQIMLFYGEQIDYNILDSSREDATILAEGTLVFEDDNEERIVSKNRFDLLNEMSLLMDLEEENAVKDKMIEYAVMDELAARLFLK